jgi:hypothetical protein
MFSIKTLTLLPLYQDKVLMLPLHYHGSFIGGSHLNLVCSLIACKLYLCEIFKVQSFSYQGSLLVGYTSTWFVDALSHKLQQLWLFKVFLSYQGGFIGGLRLNPAFGLDLNLFDLRCDASDST